jgi:hypothetical protein
MSSDTHADDFNIPNEDIENDYINFTKFIQNIPEYYKNNDSLLAFYTKKVENL